MKGRVASIDFGLKRIGVAISDENRVIATSLGVVFAKKTTRETVEALACHFQKYTLSKIIVGHPMHLNGKEGFLADEVRFFVSHLKEKFSCDIVLWDERLSSVQAERSLKEGGMQRKKRAKVIDAVAAVILLQSYLEFLSLSSMDVF